MFVHFAPNTFQDKEGDDLSTPLSAINPDIDTDNWAECAVNLGARYIVFVAKHAGGFCMWQTKTTKYSIANTPWKGGRGDVLGDLAASCRKHGLRLGVYLSPRDDYFGAGVGGVCKDPSKQAAYNAMYREQLTEVLTRYGEMVEVWFDGSSVVPASDLVRKYAAHAAIFQGPDATIRWVGNEIGFAPYPLWNAESKADATERHIDLAAGRSGRRRVGACGVRCLDPQAQLVLEHEERTEPDDARPTDRGLLPFGGPRRKVALEYSRGQAWTHAGCGFTSGRRSLATEIKRRFGKSVAATAGNGARVELKLDEAANVSTT